MTREKTWELVPDVGMGVALMTFRPPIPFAAEAIAFDLSATPPMVEISGAGSSLRLPLEIDADEGLGEIEQVRILEFQHGMEAFVRDTLIDLG